LTEKFTHRRLEPRRYVIDRPWAWRLFCSHARKDWSGPRPGPSNRRAAAESRHRRAKDAYFSFECADRLRHILVWWVRHAVSDSQR
jgi:hypothetical protein